MDSGLIFYIALAAACAVLFVILAFVTNHFLKQRKPWWLALAALDGLALGGCVIFALLCVTN